ncbi:MAG: hypothetical protein HUN04_01005 [Desulfobacter sp.]|nr:MAG: hypothetical protein HUN04_01005 [Desulfobacter sp.]
MSNRANRFTLIVNRVLAEITNEEAEALYHWTASLLTLRNSGKSRKEKLRTLIGLTRDAPLLFPLIKKIALELKRTGWDEAGWQSRLGTGATLWATLAIAGSGARLAMLGTAIAVPLWIVFGSGDRFAKQMIQMLKQYLSRQ